MDVNMFDLNKLGKEMSSGVNAGAFKELAGSDDMKKIGGMIDKKALESAAKSGDTAALSEVLAKIMNSEEGKRLASKISGLSGK